MGRDLFGETRKKLLMEETYLENSGRELGTKG